MKFREGHFVIELLGLVLSAAAPPPSRAECLPVHTTKLIGSDTAAADDFCSSVSISGDTVLNGAEGDDNANGVNAGSAYVFELDCPTRGDLDCNGVVDGRIFACSLRA